MPSGTDCADPIGMAAGPRAVALLGHAIAQLRSPLEFMDSLRYHGAVARTMAADATAVQPVVIAACSAVMIEIARSVYRRTANWVLPKPVAPCAARYPTRCCMRSSRRIIQSAASAS